MSSPKTFSMQESFHLTRNESSWVKSFWKLNWSILKSSLFTKMHTQVFPFSHRKIFPSKKVKIWVSGKIKSKSLVNRITQVTKVNNLRKILVLIRLLIRKEILGKSYRSWENGGVFIKRVIRKSHWCNLPRWFKFQKELLMITTCRCGLRKNMDLISRRTDMKVWASWESLWRKGIRPRRRRMSLSWRFWRSSKRPMISEKGDKAMIFEF